MTPKGSTGESTPSKPLRLGQQVRAGLVRDLRTVLTDVDTVVVARVDRVAARELNRLRQALSAELSSFWMVKNSLCRLTFQDLGWSDLGKTLEGSCGISPIKGDVGRISKLLGKFSKDHEGFVLKGGILKGELLQAKDWLELGRLPSREVLLSQCAGILQSPIRNLATVLQGPLRSMLLAFQGIILKKTKKEI